MYQQSYEDYMRMVLGYQPTIRNDCENCHTYQDYMASFNIENSTDLMFEDLYPNIFHILNPIVAKVCSENTKPMCKEVLEDMTEKIYRIIEEREVETTTTTETKTMVKSTEMRTSNGREDARVEDRNRNNNFLLRDLIKILILNRILNQNRPPRPGHRPPRPRIYDYM